MQRISTQMGNCYSHAHFSYKPAISPGIGLIAAPTWKARPSPALSYVEKKMSPQPSGLHPALSAKQLALFSSSSLCTQRPQRPERSTALLKMCPVPGPSSGPQVCTELRGQRLQILSNRKFSPWWTHSCLS